MELNNLPNSIEHLELSEFFCNQILNIPKSLVKVKCSKLYEHVDDFKSRNIEVEYSTISHLNDIFPTVSYGWNVITHSENFLE